MKYIIGIDGGGSKSVLKIADLSGNILFTAFGGPTNILSGSLNDVHTVLTKLIRESIGRNGLLIEDCIGFCIGTAGAGRLEEKMILEDMIKSLGIKGNIVVTTDAEIVLAAETGKVEGIVIIAGTGSIAYGIDKEGKKVRTGGWGHILGDEGSGYYIGLEAIKSMLRSYDGREPYTELLPMIIHEMKLEKVEDIINVIYKKEFNKAEVASLAKIVDEAYKKGDKKAKEILRDASIQLFKLAEAVIKVLKFDNVKTTLVASGSILLKNNFIFDNFSRMVYERYPLINIRKLTKCAALGAVKIALDSLKDKENRNEAR